MHAELHSDGLKGVTAGTMYVSFFPRYAAACTKPTFKSFYRIQKYTAHTPKYPHIPLAPPAARVLEPPSSHWSKHVRRPAGVRRASTCACTPAATSAFVLAFITVTLAKQPAPTTVPSSGSRAPPHAVGASTALAFLTSRVNTQRKSLAVAQPPLGAPDEENVVPA